MNRSVSAVAIALAMTFSVLFLTEPAQAGNWSPLPSPGYNLYTVDFIDASNGWVGGTNWSEDMMIESAGFVSRTDAGGSSWASSGEWDFLRVMDVDFIDGSRGWASLSDGTILSTTTGGSQWTVQAEGSLGFADNNWGYASLMMADATHGCAVGGWTGLLGISYPRIVFTQDGREWKPASVPELEGGGLESVCMVDAEYGWAVGSAPAAEKRPLVLVTHDGGATWTRQTGGLPLSNDALHGVWFVDRQHGWAVGDLGSIYATSDGGVTWEVQQSGVSESLLGVCFAGPNVGWAVGEGGTILETTLGGSSWVLQAPATTEDLRAVTSAGGRVWAVGEKGIVLSAAVPGGGFSDIASSPYRTAIESLASAGIVGGFTDGTFRPDGTVTRQQFAKMVVGALNIAPNSSTVSRFIDLGSPDANGYPHVYVQVAYDKGITYGTNSAQTLFAPLDNIRRDQAVSLIVRGANSVLTGGLATPPAGTTSLFAGVGEPHGENLRIAEYNGLLDDLLGMGLEWNVMAAASRGEVAQMLYNLRQGEER